MTKIQYVFWSNAKTIQKCNFPNWSRFRLKKKPIKIILKLKFNMQTAFY